MNEDKIKQIALQVFQEQLAKTQFDVSSMPYHTHNQTDSPRIPPTSVLNFVNLPATKGTETSGVISTDNIGVSYPPFPTVYPIPIITGYGVGVYSQFNGGEAPVGSSLMFQNVGLDLYQLWIRTVDADDVPIWVGVDLIERA